MPDSYSGLKFHFEYIKENYEMYQDEIDIIIKNISNEDYTKNCKHNLIEELYEDMIQMVKYLEHYDIKYIFFNATNDDTDESINYIQHKKQLLQDGYNAKYIQRWKTNILDYADWDEVITDTDDECLYLHDDFNKCKALMKIEQSIMWDGLTLIDQLHNNGFSEQKFGHFYKDAYMHAATDIFSTYREIL